MGNLRPLIRLASTASVALVLLAGCSATVEEPTAVRVGAGSTAEQQLLAALAVEVLDARGIEAELVSELGDTAAVREAALAGRVDVVWGYSGATWILGLGLSAPPVDGGQSFEAVAAEDGEDGLRWLGPSQVDASLALFVAAADAPPPEEATTSWLAGQLAQREGSVCADAAFLGSPAGWPLVADTYAIATDLVTTIPAPEGKAVESVAAGECFAGLVTATSGPAQAAGLIPLADDQGVFPAMVVAPVVVEGSRAAAPPVEAALIDLAAQLRTADLAALNARVVAGELIAEVAATHVAAAGLEG